MADDRKSNSARDTRPRAQGPGPGGGGPGGQDRPRRERRGPREGGDGPREGASEQAPAREGERADRRDGPRRDDRPRDRRDDRRGPPPGRRDTSSPLTASLFSAVQDKEMPCRIAGCGNTWTWFAAQQIRGFGQKPPDRMCDQHLAQFSELSDREVPCRTPGCPGTWLWKRGAQLAELQRHGRLKRPARLCNDCVAAERETADAEMPCKVEGCRRSWIWPRDAQLRHRLWVLRQRARARAAEAAPEPAPEPAPVAAEAPAEASAPPAPEAMAAETGASPASEVMSAETPPQADSEAMSSETPGDGAAGEGEAAEVVARAAGEAAEPGEPGKKRRRRRRKQHVRAVPDPEGPPQRMCSLCAQKLARIAPKEVPCKVHGCSRTWVWDRAGQLRAWVLSGSDDVDFEPAAPKRMCETCREFCRKHPDRAVPCGRPGCEATWMYKTGAQLQAFLAGRLQDPLKLCDECARGEFAKQIEAAGLPEGAEIMPCVVPACDGTWVYIPGQKLQPVVDGELPTDRMCTKCRRERGLAAPEHEPPVAELEVSPEDTAPADTDDADELLADDDGAEAEVADTEVADTDTDAAEAADATEVAEATGADAAEADGLPDAAEAAAED